MAYGASLVALATVHTFGLFQWPAQLVATLTSPGDGRRSRPRDLLAVAGTMLVAALVAGTQVVASVTHGTGPVAPDAYEHLGALELLDKVGQAVTYTDQPAAAALLLGLAGLGAALAVRGRHAPFARTLVVWAVTPLVLELAAAALHTNLFRIRYWIALLPPLAALAGLGTAVVATVVGGLVRRRLPEDTAPSTAGRVNVAVVAAVTLALLGGQVALSMPAHSELRSAGGHGQDLGPILGIIESARRADPAIPVLIPSEGGAGIFACIDPELQRDDPLRTFDPQAPTVFTVPAPVGTVRARLATARRVLWIFQTPAGTHVDDRVPRELDGLHLEVAWITETDLGWTALLLERTVSTP